MGFTEIVDDRTTEFFLSDAPLEYRLALIEKMEGMFATEVPHQLENMPQIGFFAQIF